MERRSQLRLRSFHLELIAQKTFGELGSDMRLATQRFFEWAPKNLHVNDPAGYSGDMAAGLTYAQTKDILSAFDYGADHAERARQAEAEGRPLKRCASGASSSAPAFRATDECWRECGTHMSERKPFTCCRSGTTGWPHLRRDSMPYAGIAASGSDLARVSASATDALAPRRWRNHHSSLPLPR